MEACCDVEVEVDGETFMVDKKIISSFCGKIRKLFHSRVMESSRNVKVVFHDFPGGAEGFELVARFCYNNGTAAISPSNLVLLNCAAAYMEMESDGPKSNLRDQIKVSVEGISFWTWSELLVALKECQQFLLALESSFILDKVLDCIVSRILLPVVGSPYTSFSDTASFQCSSDMRSSYSLRSNWSQQQYWWFEDLLTLNIDLVEKVIETMLSHNLDSGTICKFLLYYHKSTFHGARPAEKRRIAEVVISLVSRLDKSSLSCKVLFYLFRTVSYLVISKYSRDKLESLIGSHLHQASIDHLLVPSPSGKRYMYDVNLVLRLVAAFCMGGSCWLSPSLLKKVASLVDSYLVEVAADPHLRPSKFAALVLLLPDYARESHDKLCQAMELYFHVHKRMHEEEKLKICSALNYEKLSRDTLRRLARYPKFPSRISVQGFINQQSKLPSFLQEKHHGKPFSGLVSAAGKNAGEKEDIRQMVLCARRLNYLKMCDKLGEVQVEGTPWKATQLGEIYGAMHSQIENISRTRMSSLGNNARYLPKLCS